MQQNKKNAKGGLSSFTVILWLKFYQAHQDSFSSDVVHCYKWKSWVNEICTCGEICLSAYKNTEVRLGRSQDHSEGKSKYFSMKWSCMCCGRVCSLSAAGISICCLNLYAIMTSAPTFVITLLCTDMDGRNLGQEEILLTCSCWTAQNPSWMDECVCCCVIR